MIDEKRIADFFAELVSIDSPSLEEREMADTLKIKFAEIGVTLTEDHTQEQTGSNAGNLFARIPGSLAGAPVLFAAHMDTVEPAKGKKAVSHEDGTVTSDGTTASRRPPAQSHSFRRATWMKAPLPTSEKSAAAPVPTSFRKAA